jgi:hypothetical protein
MNIVGNIVGLHVRLARLGETDIALNVRPLGPDGRVVADMTSASLSDADVALVFGERSGRDSLRVAGVSPEHCVFGDWTWTGERWAMRRGSAAWFAAEAATLRELPRRVAALLAAVVERGDPAMHGVAVRVNDRGAVWRPVVPPLPAILTVRRAWGLPDGHIPVPDWWTWDDDGAAARRFAAAVDAAIAAFHVVYTVDEVWLLRDQAQRLVAETGGLRVARVEELRGPRDVRLWHVAGFVTHVRLSHAAREVLVQAGLLPALDEAAPGDGDDAGVAVADA